MEFPEWNCHDCLAGATHFPGIARAHASQPASGARAHASYSIPGGGSLLAFRLPARVYRLEGSVGVSTLEIQVLS